MLRVARLPAWIVPVWLLWELTSLSGPKWQGRTPPDSEMIRDAYDTKAECERMIDRPVKTLESDGERTTIRMRCLPQGVSPR
jgi:hypothetical protein